MARHWITLMVFTPIAGAILQALIPMGTNGKSLSRWAALGASVLSSLFAAAVIFSLHSAPGEAMAPETISWVGSYAISYDMIVDGLSVFPVLLIAVLFPILVTSEWDRKSGAKGMYGLFLVLQAAFFGTVCARDLFLQFFFWGLSALPFYFLIGIWGGENKERAAFQSVVVASLGNSLIFIAFLLVYHAVDPHTFSLQDLAAAKLNGRVFSLLGKEYAVSPLAFAFICAGLALRTPVWPFHGWFTRVSEEAPWSVVVGLCGVGLPVAFYIFVRLAYTLFPETVLAWSKGLVFVGTLNLLLGGICAVAQRGLRGLLAFICLSETGLLLVGVGSLTQAGLAGAVYQGLVLGLALAGFGLVSGLISARAGHSEFVTPEGKSTFGGLAVRTPTVALVAGLFVVSLIGFPGFGGFIGRALLVIGSFSAHPLVILAASASLLLATYYLFTMYRFVFLGKESEVIAQFNDLTFRERAYLFPLVGTLIILGAYPKPLLDLVQPTVALLLSSIK